MLEAKPRALSLSLCFPPFWALGSLPNSLSPSRIHSPLVSRALSTKHAAFLPPLPPLEFQVNVSQGSACRHADWPTPCHHPSPIASRLFSSSTQIFTNLDRLLLLWCATAPDLFPRGPHSFPLAVSLQRGHGKPFLTSTATYLERRSQFIWRDSLD